MCKLEVEVAKRKKTLDFKRVQQVNLFRSIINSNPDEINAEYACFSQISNIRCHLNPLESLNAFKNFLSLPKAKQLMNLRYISTGFDVVNIKKTNRHKNNTLCDEINWIAEVIKYFQNEVNEFVHLRDRLERYFLHGDYDKANKILQKIEDITGVSEYTINYKLNILYFQEKIIEHSEFTKSFEDLPCELSKTILLYDGVKSNRSVSAERYLFSIGQMKEEVEYEGSSGFEEVISFRHNFNPSRKMQSLTDVIFSESEKRLVDLYLVLMKSLSYVYVHDINIDNSKSKLDSLRKAVNDRRLNVIFDRLFSCGINDELDSIHYLVADSYYKEDYEHVVSICEKQLLEYPEFSSLYEPYAKSLLKIENGENKFSGVLGECISLLVKVYCGDDRESSLKSLEKIHQVLNHNSWSYGLMATLQKYKGEHSLDLTKLYDFNDSMLVRKNLFSCKDYPSLGQSNTSKYPGWRISKINADIAFFSRQYKKAFEIYDSLSECGLCHIDEEISSKKIQCYFFDGDIDNTVKLLSSRIKQGVNVSSLPIRLVASEVASRCTFKTDTEMLIDEVIILNEYNKIISSDYVQQVSDICENILENIDIVDFDDVYLNLDLIPEYLIENVFNLNVLSGMPCYFSSPFDVLKARLKLNKIIISNSELNDSSKVMRALSETKSIIHKIIMDICSNEAGEGKVYVDRESLKLKLIDYVKRELEQIKESKLDVTKFDEVTVVIDEVSYHVASDVLTSKVSEILFKILEEYTVNKLYGIDQSLNVGIRHGGMVNLLWAPLKNNNLAANKSKDNKFFPNPSWRRDLAYYKEDILEKNDDLLVKFNVGINDLIQQYKTKVHINTGEFASDSKLFNYFIDIEKTKEICESINEETAESLIDKSFDIFDEITEECLSNARELFISELENDYMNCIDKLKEDIFHDSCEIDTLNRSIANAKIEAKTKIETLKSYFDWLGKSETTFTLSVAFEKALEVVKEINPWAKLVPDGEIKTYVDLKGEYFHNVVTILSMLIENITKYSNLPDCILFKFEIDKLGSKLNITFSNEVYGGISEEDKQSIIKIANRVNTDFVSDASKEKGSGLYKIKRILSHDIKLDNYIDIKVEGNGFHVSITIEDISNMQVEL